MALIAPESFGECFIKALPTPISSQSMNFSDANNSAYIVLITLGQA